ncbi:hypothetical protein ACFRQM_49330 [Streptomyces sp. NPDC056831]|uniref:hypothetical protein n=1 Tax=Streptomyces sp. NPDC056831 TaxID=3345954 RepID=UPI0036B901B0
MVQTLTAAGELQRDLHVEGDRQLQGRGVLVASGVLGHDRALAEHAKRDRRAARRRPRPTARSGKALEGPS